MASGSAIRVKMHLRRAALLDFAIAVASSAMAIQVRFGSNVTFQYAALGLIFPLLWVLVLWLSAAYDDRYIGIDSDEFRKVLNAGVSPTVLGACLTDLCRTRPARCGRSAHNDPDGRRADPAARGSPAAQRSVPGELDGLLFKMRRDPRVTAIGARLRKWSADELPLLINVVKPGLTGL